MKNSRIPWLLLLALVPASFPARAANWFKSDEPNPNRFNVAARFGFNITAKIQNLGPSGEAFSGTTSPDPGPATPGGDHNYDDGYNRVDFFGNDGGLTWNWGYASANQIVGDQLVMSRALPGDLTGDFNDDPQTGAELTYNRQLGRLGYGRWGLEVALGYLDLSLENTSAINSGVLAVDAYGLGGELPPAAGYRGSFGGPGQLLSDAPARADTLISILNGHAWSARLGPYAEFPLARHVALSFSGGLALLHVESEFQYQEMATISGVPAALRAGAGSRSETLVGGYAAANLSVALSEAWTIMVGVQYQHVGDFTQNAGDKQARIDFGKTIFATAGLSFAF